MPLTDLEELRFKIGDRYVAFKESILGDGSTKAFSLSSYPIRSTGTAVYVNTSLQTETTHYTLNDDTGELEFTSAPALGVLVQVNGQASIFSDTELNDLLTNEGTVQKARVQCYEILLLDRSKQNKWIAGDGGISVDPTPSLRALTDLIKIAREEVIAAAIEQGGIEEWAVAQQEFR